MASHLDALVLSWLFRIKTWMDSHLLPLEDCFTSPEVYFPHLYGSRMCTNNEILGFIVFSFILLSLKVLSLLLVPTISFLFGVFPSFSIILIFLTFLFFPSIVHVFLFILKNLHYICPLLLTRRV